MFHMWREYCEYLNGLIYDDLSNDNFVTLDRIDEDLMIYETILTFNGILIHRRKLKYACDATSKSCEENFRKSYEE